MHPRRAIREGAAAAIAAGSTAAQDRVWAAYEPPVSVERVLIDEGPVVLVYTRRDTIHPDDYPASGAGAVRRTCELCVEILAAGDFTVDDKLDDLAEQVEAIVDGIVIAGQPATEIRLTETNIASSDQFEVPVGAVFLLFDAKYWKDWRVEDEDPFFPNQVSSSAFGRPQEVVADCVDCDDCPPGGRP